MVVSPSERLAKDILWIEHQIDPRLPIIKFTGRTDTLRGYRKMPVLTLDPRFELNDRDRYDLSMLAAYKTIVGWTEKDFEYLRELTRNPNAEATNDRDAGRPNLRLG